MNRFFKESSFIDRLTDEINETKKKNRHNRM